MVIKAWCHCDTSWCRYGVIVTPLGVQLTPAKGVTVLTPLEGGVQLAQTLDTPFLVLPQHLRFYSVQSLLQQCALRPEGPAAPLVLSAAERMLLASIRSKMTE